MIFISFAIIFTIGYPVYNSYIDNNHMENVEKSFYILAQNANLVAMQKSILTSSELKMYGGTLATRDTGIHKYLPIMIRTMIRSATMQ